MNCADVGNLIRKLRTDLNMTQKQLADKLGVSDKAVSKWERGLGCPDITLVTELSEILSVSLESLLSGSTEASDFKEVNMKKNKYYICPQCGNITVCTGDAEVSCCGRKLTAATPVKAAEEQKLSAEIVEDEWFISGSCPMTKDDYISFAVFITGDRMNFVKLYPEWDLHFRIPRGHGTLMWYGEKCGLLYQLI